MSFSIVKLFKFNIFHLQNLHGLFLCQKKKRISDENVYAVFVSLFRSSSNLSLNSKWIESNYKRPKYGNNEHFTRMKTITRCVASNTSQFYSICCASWLCTAWYGMVYFFCSAAASHKHGKLNAHSNNGP